MISCIQILLLRPPSSMIPNALYACSKKATYKANKQTMDIFITAYLSTQMRVPSYQQNDLTTKCVIAILSGITYSNMYSLMRQVISYEDTFSVK